MKIGFFGGAQTVTGSRFLVTCGKHQVLIDCGMFQGFKNLRLKNWAPLPFDPRCVDAVLLTHAHIDHSGYLPRFINEGFGGEVLATRATTDLCKILLPDSGYLQEEQARFANKHGFSKHHPALPLYTEDDARRAMKRFKSIPFAEPIDVAKHVRATFHSAGHLLGASSVRIEHEGRSVLFSGDLGRSNDVLMRPPSAVPAADYVVIESTYGDRVHPEADPMAELAAAIQRAVKDDGIVLIPTFAIGRAQALMLLIARLKKAKAIPDIPVFLDSPMAIDATELYVKYAEQHRLSAHEAQEMCSAATYVRTAEQSKALSALRSSAIILAASGMATGGRVVHHLKMLAPDARNLILLSGFQAGGTRGALLANGATHVRIHGQEIAVRAEVAQLSSISGHADAHELIAWLKALPTPPRRVFVTHGEPAASDALRQRIEHELGWNAVVPDYRDEVEV